MYRIASRIVMPDSFIFLEWGDSRIVVNPDTSNSAKISMEDCELLKNILKIRNKNYSDYVEFVDSNEQAVKLLKQLLLANVCRMQNSVAKDNKYDISQAQVYWGITDICNFRCLYCYADCSVTTVENKAVPLELKEYKNIIDAIARYGYRIINITGGEPLLNPYIFKIARYAKSKGLVCGILTNGSLINEENVEKCKIFDFIKISLDSHIPEINDQTRGAGTYNTIIRAISLLRDNNIEVGINSVITRNNMNYISEFITYMYHKFQIKEHVLSNHISVGRGQNDNLGCTYEEIKKCNNLILSTKSALGLGKKYTNSIVQDSFLQVAKKVSCGMGSSEIFIDKVGDIYPCRMSVFPEYRLGNVLIDGIEKSLERVTLLQESLNVDNLECTSCLYKYICGGGCRICHRSYTGSINVNDKGLCEMYKDQIKNLIFHRHGIIQSS